MSDPEAEAAAAAYERALRESAVPRRCTRCWIVSREDTCWVCGEATEVGGFTLAEQGRAQPTPATEVERLREIIRQYRAKIPRRRWWPPNPRLRSAPHAEEDSHE
ncbi:MAG: hypothetical protein M3O70_05730 [Actinomycetota bacterium]|nr:hypothetical protein [Actinomycetota bacterium]